MSIFEFEETPAQHARMTVVGVGGGGGNFVHRLLGLLAFAPPEFHVQPAQTATSTVTWDRSG